MQARPFRHGTTYHSSSTYLHFAVHLHLILAYLFIRLLTRLPIENSGLRTSVPIYTDTSRALYKLFGFTDTIDTAGPEDPKRAYVVDTYWEGVWKSLAVRRFRRSCLMPYCLSLTGSMFVCTIIACDLVETLAGLPNWSHKPERRGDDPGSWCVLLAFRV
jgi:hypothetical protein